MASIGTVSGGWELDNPTLDSISHDERKRYLVHRFRSQIAHMKEQVPFYRKAYHNIEPDNLDSLQSCIEQIPLIRKEDVRNLSSPYDLVSHSVRNDPSRIYLFRATGGSTGVPTSMFFTWNDWSAVIDALVASMPEIAEIKNEDSLIAYNGYHQGHIAGPSFNDLIRRLNGAPIIRHFTADDEQAVRDIARHECNMLISPPTSTHKGGTLEDLLDADARMGTDYINGENIKCLVLSSTPISQDLIEEIRDLGIPLVYNFYGSTDVLPTAASCQEHPDHWHISFRNTALFVVDENQRHVENGEKGFVVASRLASSNGGLAENAEATQLLNYFVGDEARYINEPCGCGRTTPRITEINRVAHVQDKIESGCEAW